MAARIREDLDGTVGTCCAGDNVGVLLRDVSSYDVQRGDVLSAEE